MQPFISTLYIYHIVGMSVLIKRNKIVCNFEQLPYYHMLKFVQPCIN